MIDIVAQLRATYLFYHQAHHMAAGMSFFGDHKAFEKFYHELEDEYDKVAERTVLFMGREYLDLKVVLIKVEKTLNLFPPLHTIKQNLDFFKIALALEKELCGRCHEQISIEATEGLKQLLGDICNQSEMRQYKLHQRIIP